MKKIAVFLIALSIVFPFAGCSQTLPANEDNAQNEDTTNTTQAPSATQNPDLILEKDTEKKWKEDYERDKVAIDGIVLEKPGYKRVDFKYYYVKQNGYGGNQITLEMEITNLSDMDLKILGFTGDIGAKTVDNGRSIAVPVPIDTSLDKPGMGGGRSNDVIRAGGTMTVIQSYGLNDLESDVELSVNANFQKLSMPDKSQEMGIMEPETAILKIK